MNYETNTLDQYAAQWWKKAFSRLRRDSLITRISTFLTSGSSYDYNFLRLCIQHERSTLATEKRTQLFFDLDGTLVDSQPGIELSIRHTLDQLGVEQPCEQRLRDCFGPPLRISFASLLDTQHQPVIEQAVTLFRQHYLQQGIHHYRIYPGISALLQQLADSCDQSLAVLTAKPQAQAEWILTDAGLAPYFQQVFGSTDQGVRSCKSRHLGHLIAQQQLTPSHCWMIGDRACDIEAAKANATRSVAVSWGYASDQELGNSDYCHLIDSPGQLLAIIEAGRPSPPLGRCDQR
ncbi:HAD family hydrolase [Motiliproteus coralliicola]|uniref:HAD family hydrolase n=1 Tax=Motiliproteus coralliicola TaxID=2283196 RepID=A0A369WMY4_9GAMM|nr:HAD family hydrolase [Motiliproteus coralliicola]